MSKRINETPFILFDYVHFLSDFIMIFCKFMMLWTLAFGESEVMGCIHNSFVTGN